MNLKMFILSESSVLADDELVEVMDDLFLAGTLE